MIEWLKNHNYILKNETRAKFYVGITRARYSVALVVENINDDKFKNYKMYVIQLNQFIDDEKILERLSEKQRDKNAKYAFKK